MSDIATGCLTTRHDATIRSMARPFLKWAGGKARLAAAIAARAPTFRAYHEPFIGGGAVFFELASRHPRLDALLADANAALVEAYVVVRDNVDELIAALAGLEAAYLAAAPHERSHVYYRQRQSEPRTQAARAARLLFLNRTCYNGLYRVNRSGAFNVPHGRYRNPRICRADELRDASHALQTATISVADFADACAAATPGDFVYLDPPYVPLSATAHFTAYTGDDFGPADQVRLADAFAQLTERGVAALLSNSDHPTVRELYAGQGYDMEVVAMSRAINSHAGGRAPIGELLIGNLSRLGLNPARPVSGQTRPL